MIVLLFHHKNQMIAPTLCEKVPLAELIQISSFSQSGMTTAAISLVVGTYHSWLNASEVFPRIAVARATSGV
jgi:hypothetical protein